MMVAPTLDAWGTKRLGRYSSAATDERAAMRSVGNECDLFPDIIVSVLLWYHSHVAAVKNHGGR